MIHERLVINYYYVTEQVRSHKDVKYDNEMMQIVFC